jgi:cobalt-zinc-cadmium efflux system outer membrane protein
LLAWLPGRFAAAILALVSALAHPAAASESAASRLVTLEDALAAAGSVPEVVIARAAEAAASAGIRSARTPAEPKLLVATRSVSAKEGVAMSIPFRWGGQKASAVSEAEAGLDAASRSSVVVMATARRACRVAWYALAASEDRLRAAKSLTSRSERNHRAIADLYELQRASRLDAVRAQAAAASAAAAEVAAEQEVIAASAELRALLGVDAPRLTTGDDRPQPPPEGEQEAWSARARSASPDLAAAQGEVRVAEARVSRLARERRPSTSLEAGADWNDPTQPGTDALLGLEITFPTRGRAAQSAAEADRDAANARLELARRRVEADLASAWSAAAAARGRFEVVDRSARPAAAEAAELTRVAYAEGKLDLFRLLDAEQALADAERDRADAYLAWGVAYADLERLAPQGAP